MGCNEKANYVPATQTTIYDRSKQQIMFRPATGRLAAICFRLADCSRMLSDCAAVERANYLFGYQSASQANRWYYRVELPC